MGRSDKLLMKILSGFSDANIKFSDLCSLLKELGFDERIKGDHHIFTRGDIIEIIKIQPRENMGKPYQVKQIRNLGIFQKGAKVVYTFPIQKSGFISHKDTKAQRNEDFVFFVPLCDNHKSVN